MADQREFKIGVLAGDGIGPEITDATMEVLQALYRRLAEAAEQRQKPQPTKTVYAKGSVEWFAEQKKSG